MDILLKTRRQRGPHFCFGRGGQDSFLPKLLPLPEAKSQNELVFVATIADNFTLLSPPADYTNNGTSAHQWLTVNYILFEL
jgi:hypothetical protein